MKNLNKYSVQEIMNSTVFDVVENHDFEHETDVAQEITLPENCIYLEIVSPFDFYWTDKTATELASANVDRHIGLANQVVKIGPRLSGPYTTIWMINKVAAAGDTEEVSVQVYI